MAATVAATPMAGAQIYSREDALDANYLIGLLTWDDEGGHIRWGAAPSEDPGGPGADFERDRYVSDPLPTALRVNASRLIQVDVFTKDRRTDRGAGTSCLNEPKIRAELRVGDTLAAGVAGPHWFQISTWAQEKDRVASFPDDPPGYGVCRLRLAVEEAELQKGSVLTLRFIHYSDGVVPYGMAGDHQSVIRIPYFPEAEAAFRYPSYAHGSAATSAKVDSTVRDFAGKVGAAGLALPLGFGMAWPRKRGLALVVGLLFAGAALPGCVERPSATSTWGPGDDLPGDFEAPTYQEGDLSDPGLGSIIGQVVATDVGRPIHGAHALLMGTSNATRTDQYGRFVFTGLVAGEYLLRLDAKGYQTFEGKIAVLADLIARLNVSLMPLVQGNGDARPHLHDYWGLDTERVLMDDVDLGVGSCDVATVYCNPELYFRPPMPPSGSEYSSILPGTHYVNVTLHWNPQQAGYDTMGLRVQANNDASLFNETWLLPRGPDVPFRIATTWEMTDPGHQHFSTWTFGLLHGNQLPYNPTTDSMKKTFVPTFGVSLRIEKGTVPFEPAHPDFWQERTAAPLMINASQPARAWLADKTTSAYPPSEAYKYPLWWDIAWFPSQIVPPETTWLEVFVNLSREAVPNYALQLRFKSAETGAPSIECWNSPRIPGQGYRCRGPQYHDGGTATPAGRSARWIIPVAEAATDQFYSVRSLWVLGLEPKNDAATAATMIAEEYANEGQIEFSLTIIAHRDGLGKP